MLSVYGVQPFGKRRASGESDQRREVHAHIEPVEGLQNNILRDSREPWRMVLLESISWKDRVPGPHVTLREREREHYFTPVGITFLAHRWTSQPGPTSSR
jgi:hypothetical protein